MTEFLQTSLTFPTVIWSVVFAVCLLFWLLAAAGLAGHDHAHLDGGSDAGSVGDGGTVEAAHAHHTHPDHASETAQTAGMLSRLGLGGVPLTLVLTLLSFWGWATTYFVQLFVLSRLPGAARLLPGLLVMLGALIPALLLTNLLVRPLRPVFRKLGGAAPRSVVGMSGTVTTPIADPRSGMAAVEDGGAGLLLQIRTQGETLQRGERVVLLSYLPAEHAYLVTSELRFNA